MPAKRVAMRHVREIIRLKFASGGRDARDSAPDWDRGLDGQGDAEAL
jgi:hypothetical protein